MKILLGSQSKFRREQMAKIAEQLGATFEMTSAGIDEKAIRDADPRKLVVKLALAKVDAISVRSDLDADILITGDQVVLWNDIVLEKPIDEEEARQMLRGYRNSTVEIIPAIAVCDLRSGKTVTGVASGTVTFGDIPESVITELILHHNALNCCGALRAEHRLMKPFETSSTLTDDIAGSLPIELTTQLIKEAIATSSLSMTDRSM